MPEKKETQFREKLNRRLVYFAAERTLLSWVRTALGLMAFGFVVDRFGLFMRQISPGIAPYLHSKYLSFWNGTILVALGVIMNIVAGVRYFRFATDYRREEKTNPGYGISTAVFLRL